MNRLFSMMLGATAVVCALASAGTLAAARPYTVDLNHTRVLFTISHLGFSTLPGIFREMDVRFAFDREHHENSTLEVTIKAASIDMFNDRLNEHLKSAEFFNVAQFPLITFHSTKVEPVGADKAKVTGDFTMLGVTKPVTFDVTLNNIGKHPMLKPDVTAVGFGATGTVDRTAFGMTKFAPMVGKDIQFTLTMEANDAPAR